MSDTKCSYCGESMSTAGHSETVIGGGGVFDGMNVKSCPHVPRDRFWVMPPPIRAEPERMEVKWDGEPPRYVPIGEHMSATAWAGAEAEKLAQKRPILPETFPDMPGVPVPTVTVTAHDRMMRDWDAEMLKREFQPDGGASVPWSGLEAWLPVEGADHRDVYFGRLISKAQDDMRRRGEENKRRGILKHGPYGSGESGDCDADCAKCKAEKRAPQPAIDRYAAEQRRDGDQVYAPPRMSAADRAVASAEWSRQLREKVDAAKKRDDEKARETHYWDPEGGEW